MKGLKIILNGKDEFLPEPSDLRQFLELRGLDRQGIVVELNLEIIGREKWNETMLRQNDQLEILRFMGGGRTKWMIC